MHSCDQAHCARSCKCYHVQYDVVMGLCIKSMNVVNDAQCEYVIMQLMLGDVINMYEESIKKDHNKFAKKMHKLIYHGWHGNTRCNKAIIMGVNPCTRCKFVMGMICPRSMAYERTINKYEGLGAMCQRSVDILMLKVMAIVVDRWCIHEIQAYVRMAH